MRMSPYHFQRVFKRWAGISPKRFLQCVTVEHAKANLARSGSVLDAALATGLSGGGRLHAHLVNLEALSPGELRRNGAGVDIRHGVGPTPFGEAFIARTPRGVCALEFISGADPLAALRRRWPAARFYGDLDAADQLAEIFGGDGGAALDVRGTNFQVQVWRALLSVPAGHVVTYGRLAAATGNAAAAQAIGGAVGANPVAFLIPCHRVIRASGAFGSYRWGATKKRALLAWESSTRSAPPTIRAG